MLKSVGAGKGGIQARGHAVVRVRNFGCCPALLNVRETNFFQFPSKRKLFRSVFGSSSTFNDVYIPLANFGSTPYTLILLLPSPEKAPIPAPAPGQNYSRVITCLILSGCVGSLICLPAKSPPPPQQTKTMSTLGTSSRISLEMEPYPEIRDMSSKGWRKMAPWSRSCCKIVQLTKSIDVLVRFSNSYLCHSLHELVRWHSLHIESERLDDFGSVGRSTIGHDDRAFQPKFLGSIAESPAIISYVY